MDVRCGRGFAGWATSLAAWVLLLAPLRVSPQVPPAQPGQTITELRTLLDAPDPAVFAGDRAQLRNVPIGRVLNDRVLLLGEGQNRQLLVRLPQPLAQLRRGQRLTVAGTLDQMPVRLQPWNANEAWDLDPQARKLIAQQRIFLNATQVTVTPPASP